MVKIFIGNTAHKSTLDGIRKNVTLLSKEEVFGIPTDLLQPAQTYSRAIYSLNDKILDVLFNIKSPAKCLIEYNVILKNKRKSVTTVNAIELLKYRKMGEARREREISFKSIKAPPFASIKEKLIEALKQQGKVLSKDICEKDYCKLIDLANSIFSKGILQPIKAVEKDNKYEVVFGSRRRLAAKIIFLSHLDITLINFQGDKDETGLVFFEKQLDENTQQQEMGIANLITSLARYYELRDKAGFKPLKKSELASKFGVNRPCISILCTILNDSLLREKVFPQIIEGKITTILELKQAIQKIRGGSENIHKGTQKVKIAKKYDSELVKAGLLEVLSRLEVDISNCQDKKTADVLQMFLETLL